MENNDWALGVLKLLGSYRQDLERVVEFANQLSEKISELEKTLTPKDEEKGTGFPGTPSYEDGPEGDSVVQ